MVTLIVRNKDRTLDLVTALVSELVCIVLFGLKDPVCLYACNLDLVTYSNLTCNVRAVNVDRIVAVNEDNAAGNSAVCISDSRNDTGNSYLLAKLCLSCIFNSYYGILGGIDLYLNVLIVDKSCVLNLRLIVVCAENTMKKNNFL